MSVDATLGYEQFNIYTMRKLVRFFVAVVLLSMFAVSCTHEDDMDVIPIRNRGYLVWNGDTVDVAHVYKDLCYPRGIDYRFYFKGFSDTSLTVICIDSVTNVSICNDSIGGSEFFSSATLVEEVHEQHSLIHLDGVTPDGIPFSLYFHGCLEDGTKPTGAGSFDVDGNVYDINKSIVLFSEIDPSARFIYRFSDAQRINSRNLSASYFNIFAVERLEEGEYEITSFNNPAKGTVQIGITRAGDRYVAIESYSGRLKVSRKGAHHTFSIVAETNEGPLTMEYEGDVLRRGNVIF